MKKKINRYIPLVICITAEIVMIMHSFNSTLQKTNGEINGVLKEVIVDDYHTRSGKLPLVSSQKGKNKVKQTYIKTATGKTIYTFKDSVDSEAACRLTEEYVMGRLNPLIPDNVNKKLQEGMKRHSIDGKTGIVYRSPNTYTYSNKDSLSYHSASYQTPFYALDIAKTYHVSAWIDYDWLPLLIKQTPFYNFLLIILLAGAIVFLLITLIKKQYCFPKAPSSVMINDSIPDGWYVSPDKKLYINKTPCQIQPRSLQILQLLYDGRDKEYISREEIKEKVWGNEAADVNSRIDTHSKHIREALRNSPYDIATVRGKGFKLFLKPIDSKATQP